MTTAVDVLDPRTPVRQEVPLFCLQLLEHGPWSTDFIMDQLNRTLNPKVEDFSPSPSKVVAIIGGHSREVDRKTETFQAVVDRPSRWQRVKAWFRGDE